MRHRIPGIKPIEWLTLSIYAIPPDQQPDKSSEEVPIRPIVNKTKESRPTRKNWSLPILETSSLQGDNKLSADFSDCQKQVWLCFWKRQYRKRFFSPFYLSLLESKNHMPFLKKNLKGRLKSGKTCVICHFVIKNSLFFPFILFQKQFLRTPE